MLKNLVQNGKKFGSRVLSFARSLAKDPSFWQQSFLLIFANIIVTGLGLVRTPLITWMIPKDEVGMLSVVAVWMPFLQLASLTGLDTASYHYTSKGKPWAFILNLSYRLRWSLLSSAGLLIGSLYWMWQKEISLAWLFLIAGLSFSLTYGLSAISGTIGALELYKSLFWYRIWESLTDFTGFLPLLFSLWWVNRIITFYGLNQFATLIMQVGYSIWMVNLLKKSKNNQPSPQEKSEFVKYGKNQTGINSISVINNRIDGLLVSLFLPLNTMADYSIALLIYEQFRKLWNIYNTLRYPKLVRISSQKLWGQFIVEGILVLVGFVFIAAVVILLGYWLIPIILPPSYITSLPYITLLVFAFLASIPAGMFDTYFRTQQDHKPQYFLRLVGVFTGIISSLLLLPRLGASGVATGRICASMAQSMVGGILFLHKRPIHLPKKNES